MGEKVSEQLNDLYDLNNTKFIIIADENYFLPLIHYLPHMDTPLEGVGCGSVGYDQLNNYVNDYLKKQCINGR